MLPSAFSDDNFTLRSSLNCTAAQYDELTENVQLFSGIFDLGSIGMWIDGIDPKHSLGISSTMPTSIFQKGESLIDLQDAKFAVGDDGQLSVLASNRKSTYTACTFTRRDSDGSVKNGRLKFHQQSKPLMLVARFIDSLFMFS